MAEVCFFNKFFRKIGCTFGVLCLHYNTPMDNSIHHGELNSYVLAVMYFNYTSPINEFKINFGPSEKKRYSKEILGEYVYNFGVERSFVKILKR